MKKETSNLPENKAMQYEPVLCGVNQSNWKAYFKKLMRQLDQRAKKVNDLQKPDEYYQEKRKEFIALIDYLVENKWFVMPKKGTRIWKVYYDVWS